MSRSVEQNLTIGALAREVGLTSATLRAWEQRHGFPVPERLASGHPRSPGAGGDRVRGVLRRGEAGTRLEAAIAQVREGSPDDVPHAGSVYAELLRRYPSLSGHRLRKRTLTA